jgi:predicted RND superfamily exporter protein
MKMKIRMHNVSGVIVGIIVRHPVRVMLIAVLGAVLSLLAAATQLEFHTSRQDLISAGDRYKQLDQPYEREFEDPPERIIAVIRAEHPETAKAFAAALASVRSGIRPSRTCSIASISGLCSTKLCCISPPRS